MHPTIPALAEAARALMTARADDLLLTPERIASLKPLHDVTHETVPALDLVRAELPPTTPETLPVAKALQAAAPHVRWRRSYSQEDGFAKAFLDTYGWFDLAGPDGPYTADNLRIMFGYWGPGLHYPDHSHAQHEHYLVLAGSAWFRLAGEPFRRHGPGEIFQTPPGVVHAADMRDEPLMAIAFWSAEDLSIRLHLTGNDRHVEVR